MASSKSFLLLFCALLALVLLVSAEVSASHNDKVSAESSKNAVVDQHGGGGHCRGRHCGGGGGGGHCRGRHCGGGGGGCRHGCCGHYRGGGCRRCCANANDTPDAAFEDETRN